MSNFLRTLSDAEQIKITVAVTHQHGATTSLDEKLSSTFSLDTWQCNILNLFKELEQADFKNISLILNDFKVVELWRQDHFHPNKIWFSSLWYLIPINIAKSLLIRICTVHMVFARLLYFARCTVLYSVYRPVKMTLPTVVDHCSHTPEHERNQWTILNISSLSEWHYTVKHLLTVS